MNGVGHDYYGTLGPNSAISPSNSYFGGTSGLEGCFVMASSNAFGYAYTNWSEQCAQPLAELLRNYGKRYNRRVTYRIEIDKNPTDTSGAFGPASTFNPVAPGEADATNNGAIEFVELYGVDTEGEIAELGPNVP